MKRKRAVIVSDGQQPFIPREIIHNILKCLPVKSLLRFRCVCKSWNNLIKTPSFIAHHNSHHTPLLLLRHIAQPPLQMSCIDSEMRDKAILNNAPPFIPSSSPSNVASSNGLICLTYGTAYPPDILLWNPAIRHFRKVPRTRDFHFLEFCFREGFGFSPVTNDYKIVRVYARYYGCISSVEVYSLSTGSWKEIEPGNSVNSEIFYPQTVSVNGAIFWKGTNKDADVIVSFDIATEVFTFIPIPPSFSELCVYDDKLAVISHTKAAHIPNCPYSFLDLWVLQEGVGSSIKRSSWIKKCTCTPCPSHLNLESYGRIKLSVLLLQRLSFLLK